MVSRQAAKREELIADLTDARHAVLAAAAALSSDEQDTPFLGTWSAHDIVAHLVGWDHANRAAIDSIRSGQLPAFYEQYDRDWRTFNAGLVAHYKQPTMEETVALARASHQALLAALAGVPAGDVSKDYGVRSPGKRRVTIAMLLSVEARDEQKHAEQIRAFAGRSEG
ncbi:MAG: DinB family protein [Anaerolineae bacterium]|nr:DinB family protein [Anaerolineae bacterium]